MITRMAIGTQVPAWQGALAQAITDPRELLALLDLDPGLLPGTLAAHDAFRLRVPRGYAARMRRGDPDDPLLRQVLPLGVELEPHAGYSTDPVGDLDAVVAQGVLHKYHGRVLLVATGACAVHCRYCFRRHFPYAEANAAQTQWAEAIEHIRGDESIEEVILSGGDPLILTERRLRELTEQLHSIAHVRRLRIHTRLPVVLPERVDADLLDWLRGIALQTVVVIHANHAQELDTEVRTALAALRESGAVVLNQAVLLRGVNDSADALADLSRTLIEAGALPYYLHLLDRVEGAAHFEVPEAEARQLMAALSARIPGYLVPRLVREEKGAAGKTPVLGII